MSGDDRPVSLPFAPERLDAAITRPGRLGISVKLGEPSPALRRRIISHYLASLGLDPTDQVYFQALDRKGVLGCHIYSILHQVSVEMKLGAPSYVALQQACESYFDVSNINWSVLGKGTVGF